MRINFFSFPESKVEVKIAGFNCRLKLNIKASRIYMHVQRVLWVLFKKLICIFFLSCQNDRFHMTISQMQTYCNCKHLEVLKEEVMELFSTVT